MTAVDLLNTLEDLEEDEFQKFIWYLKDHGFMDPYPAIKGSKLEKANRRETVDLMVKTFELHGALEVTWKILQNIPRNDLLEMLAISISESEDDADGGETPENRGTSSCQSEGKHLDVLDLKNLSLVPAVKASNKALVEPAGVQWLKAGLRKYACELTINTNTVNRYIKLSHNNRKEGESPPL
ncbi:uncharacterized protein PEZ65_004290 [Lycodopsis pacificus]